MICRGFFFLHSDSCWTGWPRDRTQSIRREQRDYSELCTLRRYLAQTEICSGFPLFGNPSAANSFFLLYFYYLISIHFLFELNSLPIVRITFSLLFLYYFIVPFDTTGLGQLRRGRSSGLYARRRGKTKKMRRECWTRDCDGGTRTYRSTDRLGRKSKWPGSSKYTKTLSSCVFFPFSLLLLLSFNTILFIWVRVCLGWLTTCGESTHTHKMTRWTIISNNKSEPPTIICEHNDRLMRRYPSTTPTPLSDSALVCMAHNTKHSSRTYECVPKHLNYCEIESFPIFSPSFCRSTSHYGLRWCMRWRSFKPWTAA